MIGVKLYLCRPLRGPLVYCIPQQSQREMAAGRRWIRWPILQLARPAHPMSYPLEVATVETLAPNAGLPRRHN